MLFNINLFFEGLLAGLYFSYTFNSIIASPRQSGSNSISTDQDIGMVWYGGRLTRTRFEIFLQLYQNLPHVLSSSLSSCTTTRSQGVGGQDFFYSVNHSGIANSRFVRNRPVLTYCLVLILRLIMDSLWSEVVSLCFNSFFNLVCYLSIIQLVAQHKYIDSKTIYFFKRWNCSVLHKSIVLLFIHCM